MHTLTTAITFAWILFGFYWLISAFSVKEGAGSRRRIPLTGGGARVCLRDRGGSLGADSPRTQLGDADDPESRAGARYLRALPICPSPDLLGTPARAGRHGVGHEPARAGHCRCSRWILLLQRLGRREEPRRDVPDGLPDVSSADEDADPVRRVAKPRSATDAAASSGRGSEVQSINQILRRVQPAM